MDNKITLNKLSRYFYITEQIKSLKSELEELQSEIKASKITNMPTSRNGSSPTESLAIMRVNLENRLNLKLLKQIKEREKLEDFIDTIDDIKVSLIIRLRFIELKTWEDISKIIFTHRSYPLILVKQYLKKYNSETGGKYEIKEN